MAITSFHQMSFRVHTKQRETKAIRGLFVWRRFPVSKKRLMKFYLWPQHHGWIWSLVLREGLSEERFLPFPLSVFLCPPLSISQSLSQSCSLSLSHWLCIHVVAITGGQAPILWSGHKTDTRLCNIALNMNVHINGCIRTHKCVRLFIYFLCLCISGTLSVWEIPRLIVGLFFTSLQVYVVKKKIVLRIFQWLLKLAYPLLHLDWKP